MTTETKRPDCTIERDWITGSGLRAVCLVVLREHGRKSHRCGYVAVPKSHAAFGKEYDDVSVNVHGGLTFGRDNVLGVESSDVWWLGFDCAHSGDALIEESPYRPEYSHRSRDVVRTQEYVERECESLAAQLSNMEKANV